jgi:DNA primase
LDSQVELIKKRIDIVDLVSDYVSLKKAGRNYKALCPFHTEKTPSFMVNPERGIFKCFGCGKGGDAIAFLQEVDHLEFPEALRVLAKRAGVELKEYRPSPQSQLREKVMAAQVVAAKFYQTILLDHAAGKVALEYLKKRGLSLPTIKEWGLGYAPNQWELVTKALSAKGYSPEEVVSTGLGVASERGKPPYDRFRGRVMFPIRDITGRVIGFSGRILGEGEPKYMNSPDSLVYQKSNVLYGMDLAKREIKKANLAVLVEGNIDAIASYQAGVKNVVAPLGTALTSQQVNTLMRFTDAAALAFDADLAGDAATRRGIELAEEAGLNIRIVHLSGKDPDELIQRSPKEWSLAVDRATPIYDFYLESAFGKADAATVEGKRKIAREVLPQLARITDPILRGHYLKVVAGKIGLEEKDLEAALAKVSRERPATQKTSVGEASSRRSRQYLLEEEILKIILEIRSRPKLLIPEDFTDENLARIYKELERAYPDRDKDGASITSPVRLDSAAFVKKLPSEVTAVFDEILLKLRPEEDLDEDLERKVLLAASRELRRSSLRRFLRKLGLMIKQAQAAGEDKEVDKLNRKFRELSGKLAELEVKGA